MEIREQPSTEGEQVSTVQKQDDWMTSIVHFLKEGRLPVNKTKARNVQIRATHFLIIDDVLYQQGHSLPYLCCANSEEANFILQEIYEGIYGNHVGDRSLAGKSLRVGYYWPKLQKDEHDLFRTCNRCNVLPMFRHDQGSQ